MKYEIIDDLIDKKITDFEFNHEELKLFTENGYFHFYHVQDCCENITLEDICGDLNDIKDNVITKAEVITNRDDPIPEQMSFSESYTWTYFKIGTCKGEVTLRFFGDSNGYYSEDVDVDFVDNNGKRKRIHDSL